MIDYINHDSEDVQRRIDSSGLTSSQERIDHIIEGVVSRKVNDERRSSPRYEISARAVITVFLGSSQVPEADRIRLSHRGLTKDLSRSGAGVMLEKRVSGKALQELVGHRVRVNLVFQDSETDSLNVLGKIAWGREEKERSLLGIQFTDMTEDGRRILNRKCNSDDSEQDLIGNLWEMLVRK